MRESSILCGQIFRYRRDRKLSFPLALSAATARNLKVNWPRARGASLVVGIFITSLACWIAGSLHASVIKSNTNLLPKKKKRHRFTCAESRQLRGRIFEGVLSTRRLYQKSKTGRKKKFCFYCMCVCDRCAHRS